MSERPELDNDGFLTMDDLDAGQISHLYELGLDDEAIGAMSPEELRSNLAREVSSPPAPAPVPAPADRGETPDRQDGEPQPETDPQTNPQTEINPPPASETAVDDPQKPDQPQDEHQAEADLSLDTLHADQQPGQERPNPDPQPGHLPTDQLPENPPETPPEVDRQPSPALLRAAMNEIVEEWERTNGSRYRLLTPEAMAEKEAAGNWDGQQLVLAEEFVNFANGNADGKNIQQKAREFLVAHPDFEAPEQRRDLNISPADQELRDNALHRQKELDRMRRNLVARGGVDQATVDGFDEGEIRRRHGRLSVPPEPETPEQAELRTMREELVSQWGYEAGAVGIASPEEVRRIYDSLHEEPADPNPQRNPNAGPDTPPRPQPEHAPGGADPAAPGGNRVEFFENGEVPEKTFREKFCEKLGIYNLVDSVRIAFEGLQRRYGYQCWRSGEGKS